MNSAIQTELLRNYGLRENPFNVTPDPRFLFESRTHREALASLITGIECGTGFQALIAPPGMGKTTLLFNVLERFHDTARTAFLFQTQCNSREFLQYLLSELGVEAGDRDLVRMHEALNQVLTEEGLAHRRVIVIIDEAQNLDNSVLETVRLLSDFETKREKLMQIIISGQPELAKKLASPELEQLHQRLQVITRLTPLNQDEIRAYIEHRLKKSGYSGSQLFTPEALRLIAKHSRGTPRKINTLCFNALLLAFARENSLIDAYMVDEVIADLELHGDKAEPEPVVPGSVRLSSSLPLSTPMPASTVSRASAQTQRGPARVAEARPRTSPGNGSQPAQSQNFQPSLAAANAAAMASNAQMAANRAAAAAVRPVGPAVRPPSTTPAPAAPLPPIARSKTARKRGSWAGPVFAGIVCLALLGAIGYLYKRGDTTSDGPVVAAHSQTSQSTARPTPAPPAGQGSASPAQPQAPQAHSVTDLTVPPENPPAGTDVQRNSAATSAQPQAAQPDAGPSENQNAEDSMNAQSPPSNVSSNDEPERRPSTRQRSARAATRAKSSPPADTVPEVVTRNFNPQPAATSARPGSGNSQPATASDAAATQPPPVGELTGSTSAPAVLKGAPSPAPPAPPANAGSTPVSVPENVTLPERAARARLVYKVAPEYPGGAVNAGSSVVLKAVVGKDGTVRDLHLVSGSSQLGDAAMEAASRWQFQPYKVNGQPVEFTTELHVDFAGQ